jgi:hypothetical protein
LGEVSSVVPSPPTASAQIAEKGWLAGFLSTSPLAVPPPSHLIRDIFSGTQKAKNSKYDYADASDINYAHFSVPRVSQRMQIP